MGRNSRNCNAPNLLIAVLTCVILMQVWTYFASSPTTPDELSLREIEKEYEHNKVSKNSWKSPYKLGKGKDGGYPIGGPEAQNKGESMAAAIKVIETAEEEKNVGTNSVDEKVVERPQEVTARSVATSNITVAASGRKLVKVTSDEEFASRKAHMDEICKRGEVKGGVSGVLPFSKAKVLYCFVPKGGCTFWKTMFILETQEGGIKKDKLFSIPNLDVHRRAHIKKYQDGDYTTRFMVSRDPFSRVASAYIDKIYLPDFWSLAKSLGSKAGLVAKASRQKIIAQISLGGI